MFNQKYVFKYTLIWQIIIVYTLFQHNKTEKAKDIKNGEIIFIRSKRIDEPNEPNRNLVKDQVLLYIPSFWKKETMGLTNKVFKFYKQIFILTVSKNSNNFCRFMRTQSWSILSDDVSLYWLMENIDCNLEQCKSVYWLIW